MATALPLSDTDEYEFCVLCSSKHDRKRPSFCQCKHCSMLLCLDCMKEHHDEILQEVSQISHQYNEIKQLLESKKTMIVEETTKSIKHVNQYFENYISQLRGTQHEVIENIEKAKQSAQNQVSMIESNLNELGIGIHALAKESVVRMAKMTYTTLELSKIEQELSVYKAVKIENFVDTQPNFTVKFECPSTEISNLQSTNMAIQEIS